MHGWICRCNKCGAMTVTTDRIKKEIMRCGCGGFLKEDRQCNIGFDLALSCYGYLKEETTQCASIEGTLITDGIMRINKDDTLLLKTDRLVGGESLREEQNKIKDRTGMNVVILDGKTEIIGVIEHGS